MLKILILSLFLSVFFYNYRLNRKIIYKIEKNKIVLLVIVFYSIVAFYMTYRLDNSILGYLISISSIMLIYSLEFFQGINKEAIVVNLGNTPILKLMKLVEIKSVDIKKSNNDKCFKLEIQVFSTKFIQTYKINYKDSIVDIIRNFKFNEV